MRPMSDSATLSIPRKAKTKPKFRGYSHLIAFGASLGGVAMLASSHARGTHYAAGLIYGICLVVTLGTSALYHRPMWSLPARERMRKLDHSGIALLIAGTYTPLSVAAAHGHASVGLWVMWASAAAAIGFAVLWSYAPRGLRAAVYVVLGLVALPLIVHLPQLLGTARVTLLLVGAFIYVLGAVVYALRWPSPHPAVFGHHEVFHVLVIAAATLQFGVILDLQG